MKVEKKLLFIFVFLFTLFNFVYAKNCGGDIECECGDKIVNNYLFNKDHYCNDTGFILNENVILDCNNFSLVNNNSNRNGVGFLIKGGDNVEIKNCNIKNYNIGILLDKDYKYVSGSLGYAKKITLYPDNIIVINSNFYNNFIGIKSLNSFKNKFYGNNFYNNIYGTYLYNSKGLYYNNSFYNDTLYYRDTLGKSFCYNNVGNFYYNNSKGPLCDCLILFNNTIVNSNVFLCERDYNVNNINLKDDSELNCNGAFLIGNNNTGIVIKGIKNPIIKNCKFTNYSVAIFSDKREELEQGVLGYSYYQDIKNFRILLENNIFENNIAGINILFSRNDYLKDNIFRNNKVNIKTNTESLKFSNNYFFNGEFSFSRTSGKDFCGDKESKYFNTNFASKCDCIKPYDNMYIDSKVNFCEGVYNLKDGIKLGNNAIINCNGAVIKGSNNKNNGFSILGVRNTEIKNCIIQNYENGIYYSKVLKYNGNYITYKSFNNQITNNTILNNTNGIYMNNGGKAELVKGNIIDSINYNIVNKNNLINAEYNNFLTNNISFIKNKLDNSNNIDFEPFVYFNNTIFELVLINNSIDYMIENDKLLLEFEIYNIYNSFNFNYTIKIIGYINNSIIFENDYNFSKNYFKNYKHKFKIDLNLSKLERLGIFIIYNDNNEKNNRFIFSLNNNSLKSYKIFINNSVLNNINESFFENRNTVLTNLKNASSVFNFEKKFNPFYNNKCFIYKNFKNNKIYFNVVYYKKSILNNCFYEIVSQLDLFKNSDFKRIELNTNNNLKEKEDLKYNLINLEFNYSNKIFVYRLKELNNNYNKTIVMSGGLWSNIDTWEKLGKILFRNGYNVYLLEMTGGKYIECDSCFNYNYSYLENFVLPNYILYVKNKTNGKLNYVGHSNGARVFVSSLMDNIINSSDFDKIILVGTPGAFEDLSTLGKIIKKNGHNAINILENENKTHVTFFDVGTRMGHKLSDLLKIFNLFNYEKNDNKISFNLFKYYYYLINSTEDRQLGYNLILNKLGIIYGYFIENFDNDGIVSKKDNIRMYENIELKKDYNSYKILFSVYSPHIGMSENNDVIESIINILNENITYFENSKNTIAISRGEN